MRRLWAIAGSIALVAFPIYMAYSFSASREARQALESGVGVVVERQGDAWHFTPTRLSSGVGLVFLPGALVDPVAYAPLAHSVAESGFPVVVLSLPWRMFGPLGDPEVVFAAVRRLVDDGGGRRWVLGGHSKGGALAADFTARYSAHIAGLLLIGTSHPREVDLSRLSLPVTKIYGTRDGLASLSEVHQFAGNLPARTTWVEIAGANHAQFGWYGTQLGDGSAQIPRERQQAETLAAVLEMLQRLESPRSGPAGVAK